MSVDPLAAVADLAALLDAEVAALAADAQALGDLLVENAVVSARVLPSNGVTDLLEIAGRRVAASLPPTVRPGDVVAVRVTGFDGGRILLQIVDAGGGGSPAPTPAQTGPAAGLGPGARVAPPAGAFVAASIQPAAAPAPPAPGLPASLPQRAPLPGPIGNYVPPSARPAAPIPGAAGATGATAPAGSAAGEPTSIEARLATARASLPPPGSAPDAAAGRRAGSPPLAPPPSSFPRFVAPPQFAPKTAPPPAAGQPLAQSPRPAAAAGRTPFAAPSATPTAAAAPAPPSAGPAATPSAAAALAAYADPVTLLRALRLPVTPANVAAAALALDRPDRLPAALTVLERALPGASADPRVATLRTLLAFVGRIEPRSPVLAAQIAAFVEHVVDGAEPKLATLLAATRAAGAEPLSTLPAALAAERGAALGANLKATLLAVAADAATPEPLGPALAGALTALTAVQTQAAGLLASRPDGIAFTLPMATPNGQFEARIVVQRESPRGGGVPLDGANFRIAFTLDTAHHGTVAIDLVTVGRDVTVDVRAENARAVRAFRDALSGLTARLESLRYRVAAAGASVAERSA